MQEKLTISCIIVQIFCYSIPYPLQFPTQILEIPLILLSIIFIDCSTILYEENFTQPDIFIHASACIYIKCTD